MKTQIKSWILSVCERVDVSLCQHLPCPLRTLWRFLWIRKGKPFHISLNLDEFEYARCYQHSRQKTLEYRKKLQARRAAACSYSVPIIRVHG